MSTSVHPKSLPKNRRPAGDEQMNDAQRREPLTRERIFEAALRIIDDEGLEAISMRRLGRELGFEAMSLYNHVEDKDDILNGVRDLVLRGYKIPVTADDGWRAQVMAGAHGWRDVLRAHPNVIPLISERKHSATSVDSLRPMELALDVIRRAGLSEEETVQAFRVFGSFISGFVLMELGYVPGNACHEGGPSPDELRGMLPEGEFPCLAAMLPYFAECDNDASFDFGLELLISGLEARAAAPPNSSAPD